jgi:hypothetical protein
MTALKHADIPGFTPRTLDIRSQLSAGKRPLLSDSGQSLPRLTVRGAQDGERVSGARRAPQEAVYETPDASLAIAWGSNRLGKD